MSSENLVPTVAGGTFKRRIAVHNTSVAGGDEDLLGGLLDRGDELGPFLFGFPPFHGPSLSRSAATLARQNARQLSLAWISK
jgi:hypothetical protein